MLCASYICLSHLAISRTQSTVIGPSIVFVTDHLMLYIYACMCGQSYMYNNKFIMFYECMLSMHLF